MFGEVKFRVYLEIFIMSVTITNFKLVIERTKWKIVVIFKHFFLDKEKVNSLINLRKSELEDMYLYIKEKFIMFNAIHR